MNSLKWVLVALGGSLPCLLVLALLFCLAEDWRGHRAWEQCQRDTKAKGTDLDWKSCVPPPIPDDQNFFKAPKMQAWFQENPNPYSNSHTELWPLSTNVETTESITNKSQAENYLSWSDQFNPEFDLIRTALKRPCARMDGDYSGPLQIPNPNFGAFRSVSYALALRAKSDLILGEPEAALKELSFLNDLRQILNLKPSGKPTTLITAMMNVDISGLYVGTIAEGLRLHDWQDTQLISLQSQLQQINLPRRTMDAMSTVIPWSCRLFDTDLIPHLGRERFLYGWFLQNLVTIVTLDQQAIDCVNISSNTVSPNKLDNWERLRNEINNHHVSPGNFLATLGIPDYTMAWRATAYGQTLVNEAQIGCALERYRLAHREYPEILTVLAPQFIESVPDDIIGGQPLHYRRSKDGKFLLYSVGWDQKDDGGHESPKNEYGAIDYTNGDWVLNN